MDATGSGQKETLGTRKRDEKRGRGTWAVGDKGRTAERKARRERGGRESPEKERRSREGALEKQERWNGDGGDGVCDSQSVVGAGVGRTGRTELAVLARLGGGKEISQPRDLTQRMTQRMPESRVYLTVDGLQTTAQTHGKNNIHIQSQPSPIVQSTTTRTPVHALRLLTISCIAIDQRLLHHRRRRRRWLLRTRRGRRGCSPVHANTIQSARTGRPGHGTSMGRGRRH